MFVRTKFVLMAMLLLFLSACGQKGPLYLSEPATEQPQASEKKTTKED